MSCRTIATALLTLPANSTNVTIWLSTIGGAALSACNQTLIGTAVTIGSFNCSASTTPTACIAAEVNCAGCDSCFTTSATNTQLTLRGLTVTGSTGIAVQYSSSILLDHITMTNHSGALIANIPLDGTPSNASGTLECTACNFTDNILSSGGLVHSGPQASLTSCRFERNSLLDSAELALIDLSVAGTESAIDVQLQYVNVTENDAGDQTLMISVHTMKAFSAIDSYFRNNRGGGIVVLWQGDSQPVDSDASLVRVQRSSWINNSAHYDSWGNLFVQGSNLALVPVILQAQDCEFRGNQAFTGGAISLFAALQTGAALSMERCVFDGNVGRRSGGAISINGFDPPRPFDSRANQHGPCRSGRTDQPTVQVSISLNNVSMTSNSAGLHGGAVSAFNLLGTGKWDMKSCLFDANTAEAGGGAISILSSLLAVNWSSTVFSSNSANGSSDSGGAVRINQARSITLSGLTFTNNSAIQGGAVSFGDAALRTIDVLSLIHI